MHVRVLYFGMLRDAVGRADESISLPEGARLRDLMALCCKASPRIAEFEKSLALSVNQEYAGLDTQLRENDEVALLPPVSGGAVELPVALVHQRIVPHQIVPPLERPEDGAVVIFDGVVRDNSRGRPTLYLDYEAYEPMALAQLNKLRAEALGRFAVREVAIVHRLGRIQIGESSVLIAVFSAHRAAAYEASRWLIDTLKRTVPIWKKEYFSDGAIWADGEPFPPEITTARVTRRPSSASKRDELV